MAKDNIEIKPLEGMGWTEMREMIIEMLESARTENEFFSTLYNLSTSTFEAIGDEETLKKKRKELGIE